MDDSFATGILFTLIGSCFVVVTIYLLKRYKKVQLNGRRTLAKVLDYEEHDGEDCTYFMPIIEFKNEKSELVTTTLTFGEGKPKYKIGSYISITYLNTDSDYEIIINNKSELYFYYGFMSFGIIFGLIGLLFIIRDFL